MPEARIHDVIVVGAGNAALSASFAAAQEGASTLVLEKAPFAERGGNSAYTLGFRFSYDRAEQVHALLSDLEPAELANIDVAPYPGKKFYRDLLRMSEGLLVPELGRLLVQQSYATVKWLNELGVKFMPSTSASTKFHLAKTGRNLVRSVLFTRGGGLTLSRTEFEIAERLGVTVQYETKVLGLELDDQARVTGVKVRVPSGFQTLHARSVVIASGSFEANPELRARYLGPGWDQVKVRGTRHNTGEVLMAVLGIGAKPTGHWSGAHSTPVDTEAPMPAPAEIGERSRRVSWPLGIMVNEDGDRFVDEGSDRVPFVYAKMGAEVFRQRRRRAHQIFDQRGLPFLEAESYATGTPVTAPSLRELADKLGIDPSRLERTVEDYNRACQEAAPFDLSTCDGNATAGLSPPKSNWARTLDTPPFVAYSVTPGITFAYGGIGINLFGQALDTEDRVIPGLYAAGELVGGFFAFNYPGGSGLTRGAVTGRLAGLNAARTALGRDPRALH